MKAGPPAVVKERQKQQDVSTVEDGVVPAAAPGLKVNHNPNWLSRGVSCMHPQYCTLGQTVLCAADRATQRRHSPMHHLHYVIAACMQWSGCQHSSVTDLCCLQHCCSCFCLSILS